MSLKDKFSDKLANITADELDKLKNMEEAINENNPEKNIKLMIVKDE